MNSASAIFLITIAAIGLGHADVPKKAPLTKYQNLWTDSPFTAKPVITGPGPRLNVLQNYVLLGVAPIGDGYQVTMLNKKNPSERITVETNRPVDGFQLVEVIENNDEPIKTVVRMQIGGQQGTVAFEEKFLVIKAPAAFPAKPTIPAPSVRSPNVKVPRPRIIQPPSTNKSNGQQNSSRSNRRR